MNNQKISETSHRFFKTGLIFLFIFLLPTQLGKHFFVNFSYIGGVKIDYLAPVIYVSDILFFVLLIVFWSNLVRQIKSQRFILIAVALLFIIQSLFTIYPWLAFYYVVKMMQLYLLFLVACDFNNDRIILHGFFWGGLLQLILSLMQLYKHASLQGIFYFLGERYLTAYHPDVAKASLWDKEFLRPYGTFSHPNSLAGFYLLLYFYILTGKVFRRFFLIRTFALFIFTCLIFISFSKTAIVIYLCLNAFYLFRYIKMKCRICFLAKISVALLGAIIFLSARTDPNSLAKRVNLLHDALVILKNHLFWGVGLGHYVIYQALIPSTYTYFISQPVHNILILFFVQSGIVMGSLLIYLLVKRFGSRFKSLSETNINFLLCFGVIFLTGLADHYWLTLQQNWLVLGVVFGQLTKHHNKSR